MATPKFVSKSTEAKHRSLGVRIDVRRRRVLASSRVVGLPDKAARGRLLAATAAFCRRAQSCLV